MKTNITELVFILDKSGSMSRLESDTIGGYALRVQFSNDMENLLRKEQTYEWII